MNSKITDVIDAWDKSIDGWANWSKCLNELKAKISAEIEKNYILKEDCNKQIEKIFDEEVTPFKVYNEPLTTIKRIKKRLKAQLVGQT